MENENCCIGIGLGIPIVLASPDAKVPMYATNSSAGCDLYSIDEYILMPGERHLFHTGIHIALPIGFEAQIRPRSGLALKHGITVLNTPGTIDADYRGEVGVILINLGEEGYEVKKGERIAQMIVNHVYSAIFDVVESLDDTERGDGGYGHSGK